MAYDSFDTLYQQTCAWAEGLHHSSWINAEALAQLKNINLSAPEHLFKTEHSRPLIAAFMGGTGVGKSSLLNRLAGKAIAKVGVERPTSKEVTLYHHQAVNLRDLPPQLPLDKIRIAQHEDNQQQQLLWIDMPDFDSTEQKNQHLVLEWLPYIDVLIYVVSPERYRDNKAWQLLLDEGARHAWIFVLNQWDKGCTEQFEDFKRQLQQAEFNDPLVFKTDCTGTLTDEFIQLQKTLRTLANQHTVKQLENRGQQVRRQMLQQAVAKVKSNLGPASAFEPLINEWQTTWETTESIYHKAFAWPIKAQSERHAEQAGQMGTISLKGEQELWDEWSQQRLNDALDDVVLRADALQLPASPVKAALQTTRQKAAQWIATAMGLEVRQALANPGNTIQRLLLKISQACEIFLPIVAMGAVSYYVLQGYYQSSLTHSNYLGVDFAVHSVLLISLSWLIPFFIRKKLKPSLQKAALQGLQKGLGQGLAQINATVASALLGIRKQHAEHLAKAEELIKACQNQALDNVAIPAESMLFRMLTEK